jgi:hypothetical protein
VTLVLLIACANVANLLLARATARAREMSLRSALGAGRGRLVRQLLTEALVLGLLSVPLGIALTEVGIALVTAGVPADDVPYLIKFAVDPTTLLYTVAVAALSSVLFGLAPAWQVSRVSINAALREGGRTGSGGARAWARNVLVVGEVALALVLLVGASLFMRSFLKLQGADAGFATAPLMTMRVYLPGTAYAEPGAKGRRIEDILTRIDRVPGVQAAGASNLIPLDGGGDGGAVVADGVPVEPGQERRVAYAGVTRRYFEALNVPLARGRAFTASEEAEGAPVAVVNVSFVRRVLAARETARRDGIDSALLGASDLGRLDPIGRRIKLLELEGAPWLTIVGVVPDFLTSEMDDRTDAPPAVFVAYRLAETPNTGIIVRAAGDPAALTGALRAAVRASDSGLPIFAVATMDEVRRKGFWAFELFSWMFGIFGALALVLGSAGVYGVLAYAVSQRTQELGIRIALGASTRDVMALTVGHGLKLVAIGVGVGIVGAAAVTPVIGTLLYDVSPTDPVSFAAVIGVLGGVGLLASYIPARRAIRIDPVTALRSE